MSPDRDDSVGASKLLVLSLLFDDFQLNKKEPNQTLALEGRFSTYGNRFFRLKYDEEGRISRVEGKIGTYSSSRFNIEYAVLHKPIP